MTEWKPKAGEDAVVRVRDVGEAHAVRIMADDDDWIWLNAKYLRPLPAALSAEDAAVLRLGEIASEDRAKAAVYWGSSQAHAAAATSEHALWRAFERRRSTPPAAVAPQDSAWQPKVGDRVRVKDDPKWLRCGKRGIVRRIDVWNGGSVAYVKFDELDGPPLCYDFSGLEPDPEPATPRDTTAQDSAWVPKAGDRIRHKGTGILGTVAYVDDPPSPFVRFDNGNALWMTVDDLEIAPPRPDTTALERAVVEAAKAWQAQDPETEDSWVCMQRAEDLANAVRALLAAEAPPDPVAELREAADEAEVLLTEIAAGAAIDDDRKLQRKLEAAATRLSAALSALGDRGRG